MKYSTTAQQLADVIGLDLAGQNVIGFTIRARANGTTVTVVRHLPKVGTSSARFALTPLNPAAPASLRPLSSTTQEGGQK